MSASKKAFDSINPSNGKVIWSGFFDTETSADEKIAQCRTAFPQWRKTPLEHREQLLRKYASLLQEREDELANIISEEIGKPKWEAKTEVKAMVGKIEISIQANRKRCGEFSGGPAITRFKPHGTVLVLGPFNFPGHLPNGHICPALLAGNTVLLKPSEQAPKTAEALMGFLYEAGIPKSVIQLIHGDAALAEALILKEEIDGVFFTGSAKVGIHINKLLAGMPQKIVALEMGGNNPLIVDQVEDLEAAALLVIQSAYLTAGQRCTCARRLILTDPFAEKFLPVLLSWLERVQVGSPETHPEPFMGPVVSERAAKSILAYQQRLLSSGAKALQEVKHLEEGTGLLSPGLIDTTGIEDSDEECFGPLLQIKRVSDFEEAIEEANKTRFGLSSGLISDNSSLYEEFYDKAKAGIINFNQQLTGASSAAPFGGIGHSGNHRPSAFFAADYCAYPVASIELERASLPESLPPGIA